MNCDLLAGKTGQESYGKSKSKVPKQNAKARAVAREKGLEQAHPCKGSLGGKQSHESARRKCWRKFQDQQWNRIHWWLNSSWNWKANCWIYTWTKQAKQIPPPRRNLLSMPLPVNMLYWNC